MGEEKRAGKITEIYKKNNKRNRRTTKKKQKNNNKITEKSSGFIAVIGSR